MRTILFKPGISRWPNYFLSLGILVSSLLVTSCEEKDFSIPSYEALQPKNQDTNGGDWKPILLTSSTEIPVSAPEALNSSAYQQELNEIKSLQQNLTQAQREDIRFWASGGTLRWNEIARQLVAKYNVAPAVGTPFDPAMPFANPPVAARIYALLSVAQYDALLATWKHKMMYQRPAPAQTDKAIKPLLPISTLPSYPSEDAVVAAASVEILKFIFPKEAEFLANKVANHQNSRLWAGANVSSDIKAGDALGKLVAQKVIGYAKKDRMGQARDVNNTWQQIQVAVNWVSLEQPSRAPMLPLAGKVKTWYDSTTLANGLPGPPPAIGTAEFNAALAEVREIADNRTREQWRIADFWADGAGTSTPPGHWNKIAADFIMENQFSELRTARTFALLNRALMDAAICCWNTKYRYYLPRPSQVDPKIKTATGIPNFPSYTSGHATFSGAASEVLSYIFPEKSQSLNQQAEEAAMSRLYGGIHYRFDNDAGLKCGKHIGSVAVNWGKSDGSGQ